MGESDAHDPLARELAVASVLAREAGAIAMRHYVRELHVEYKDGDTTNPVTTADREANAAIVAGLARAFPDDAILAEESTDSQRRRAKRRLWCVDPIDGTREYVAKNGQFIVMIGLAIDGAAVLGVLYHPPTDRLLWGAGDRAFVEHAGVRTRLQVSAQAAVGEATMMVSRFQRSRGAAEAAATLGIGRLRLMGSVGLKMAELALGLADIYVSFSSRMHEWDACAPEAVLRAAGGEVTDVLGGPLRYNKEVAETPRGILATNGHLHATCRDVLRPLATGRGW